MEQHPVPQQISSYQFRLVGDMTLKQFFEIAGGIVLALIVYSLPLPAILKWPVVVIFVLLGGALAFVPIEERPLEDWLFAFFRSIYKPTIFYWKKPAIKPVYFYQAPQVQAAPGATVAVDTGHEVRSEVETQLENQEKNFFSKITGLLNAFPVRTTVQPPQPHQPEVDQPLAETATVANQTTSPIQITPAAPYKPEPKPVVAVPLVTEQIMNVPQQPISQTSVKQPISIPQPAPVRVEKQPAIEIKPIPAPQPTPVNATPIQSTAVFIPKTKPIPQPIQSAQFSPEASPPMPPTQPNIVVGQVMDAKGKIVEGAILEIADTAGRPVRALKTNKAGHFLIVTPLANGNYDLIIEKQGLDFDPLKFNATGVVIPPMAIKSKNELP